MTFSREEIQMLAQIERMMDSGEQPFVVDAGRRLAISQEDMDHFGLVSGQTVTGTIVVALLQHRVKMLTRKIAEEKGEQVSETDPEWPELVETPQLPGND